MIGDFHFLRPIWLAGVPAGLLLLWIVSRREDVRRRWRDAIAPHLLDHLIVDPHSRLRLRPVHFTVAGIIVGAIAAAGPTWERERPPFVEDRAPLAIAIDLSQTMDAIDVTPSRLERAKLKVRDLLSRRSGARTALFAYAGSAHMVLPLTDDARLIETYLEALSTSLMPVTGKDTAQALKVVDEGLAREEVPGTILFMTDGVETAAVDAFAAHSGLHQIMVLGIGTEQGGPVPTGPDTFLTDASSRRVFTSLDVKGLRALHSRAGVPVATVTTDDSDVDWIQRRVQTHLQQKQADADTRWSDRGWWLTIPLAAFSAFWFRRGWTIRWAAALVFAAALGSPSPAYAEWRFADLWLTADQQGRYHFDRGDYVTAAERFADPMWKGVAYYRAGRFEEAFGAFARVDSPESYFNQGNALAKLGRFPAAAASYQEALNRRADWPEARANLALVQKLIPPEKPPEEGEEAPNLKPDDVKFDDKGEKGKKGEVDIRKQTAEMWMRNIQTTPRDLLRRKFAIEAKELEP